MRAAAFAIAAALAVVSCSSVKTADTHVGREELYRSGNFDYDDFFEEVNHLQAGSKNAEIDEKGARAALGVALGLGETSVDRMFEALRTKTEEMSLDKSRVRFELEGLDAEGRPLPNVPPSVEASSAAKRAVPKDARKLADALGESAQGEAQVWEKYGPLPEKGRRLSGRANELRESLDRDFTDAPKAKRRQVDDELQAAAIVSGQIAETCDKVVGSATRFLKEGRDILFAASTVEPKPSPDKVKGKSKTLRSSRPKGVAPPAKKPAPATPAEETPTPPVEPPTAPARPADFNP